MTIVDELQKLQQLRDAGTLTEEEFRVSKARLLEEEAVQAWTEGRPQYSQTGGEGASPSAPRNLDSENRTWGVLLHISQFAWCIPMGGVIIPLVIWLLKKDELPQVDLHGKVVLNWAISLFIYIMICVPLIFLIVGIPMLVALGIMAFIFPIVGAVRASKGVVWTYPLSIPFIK